MRRRQRVCPNCGSTDVGMDRSNILSMMSLSNSYECHDCGYNGIFPEIDKEKVEEHREEVKKRGKVFDINVPEPPSTGRLAIGVLFILIGIPATVYGSWGGGQLSGILSLLIGAAIFYEYAKHQ